MSERVTAKTLRRTSGMFDSRDEAAEAIRLHVAPSTQYTYEPVELVSGKWAIGVFERGKEAAQ